MSDTQTQTDIARTFVRLLGEGMSQGEWQEIQRRNALEPNHCSSHDFCDANSAMEAAFNLVLKREPYFLMDDGAATQEMVEADMGLWKRAWDEARNDYLTATPEGLGAIAFEDSEKSNAGYSDRINPFDAGTLDHRAFREGYEMAFEEYFDI